MSVLRLCGASFLVALTLGFNFAEAKGKPRNLLNFLLSGNYAFTVYRSCIQTPTAPGFNPNTLELLTEGEHVTFVDTGISTFNGDGTFTIQADKILQLHPAQVSTGDIPIVPNLSSSCEGTYQINKDFSYTAESTCTAQLPSGAVLTVTPFLSVGQITPSRLVLTISEVEGTVQTTTVSLGDTVLQVSERICTTSGTLVKSLSRVLRQ